MEVQKHGFVYIWFDRKRKMFYIGCHWGTKSDGYICSSNRMRDAYRRRPEDFKRRILTTDIMNRTELLKEEYRWLSMIKSEELSKKYYNANNHHFGHWGETKDKSGKNHPMYGKKHSEESRKLMSESHRGQTPWNAGKTGVYSSERLLEMSECMKGNSNAQGWVPSDKTRELWSKQRKDVEPWNKGQHGVYSDETLQKMSDNSKGQIPWNKGRECPNLQGDLNGSKKLKGKTWYYDEELQKRVWR